MAWIERADLRRERARVWADDAVPGRRRLVSALAPLTYDAGGGNRAPVDLTPQRIQSAALDGWRITSNGWHYALGIPGSGTGAGQDGWVGFGGRRGQHWFRFRLTRLGYLHWPTRAWQDVGGAPTYSRQQLTQTAGTIDLGPETQVVETVAEWRRLWVTPQGGEAFARWRLDGSRLKEDVVITAAARTWVRNNRPPSTPAAETWFGLVFEVDLSDVPKVVRAGLEQDKEGDFADDGEPLELRSAADELLAFLPLDELIIGAGRTATHTPLQKRIWRNGDGRTYLLVGVRADILAGLPAGDLVFDPTIQEAITATADDGYSEGNTAWFNSMIYVGSGNAGQGGWRYQTPGMGQGADIESTIFRPMAAGDNSGATSVAMSLFFDDVDDAPGWANGSAPHGVVGTATKIAWTPAAWANGTRYSSPDLSGSLQTVVDRAGFSETSDIRLVSRAPTGGAWANYLQIQDYSNSAANAGILDITFTEGGGGPVELVVADSVHGHTAESPALQQAHVLSVDSVFHGHTMESPALEQAHTLDVGDVFHGHTAESPTLQQHHLLQVADSVHAHSAESPALIQGHQLDPEDVVHAHTAESPTLAIAGEFGAEDSRHGHTAESPTLIQQHLLSVASALHAHFADSPVLSQAIILAVADSLHAHLIESPSLQAAGELTVHDVLHGHTSESPVLSQASILEVFDSFHGHTAESIVWTIFALEVIARELRFTRTIDRELQLSRNIDRDLEFIRTITRTLRF